MEITPQTPIATIVNQVPGAIAVLQKYGVEFCCTGSTPLSAACEHHDIDATAVIADIEEAVSPRQSPTVVASSLRDLIAHLQQRYHEPLRAELPRLSAMLAKVVLRHGERLRDVLLPLQATFEPLHDQLLAQLSKEDQGIFPAIVDLESGAPGSAAVSLWLRDPLERREAEHRETELALATMRTLTDSYTPPADACPTFRGVYYGLAELERDLQAHMAIEQDVLFPRAIALARA